jgi:hypothetical protein
MDSLVMIASPVCARRAREQFAATRRRIHRNAPCLPDAVPSEIGATVEALRLPRK